MNVTRIQGPPKPPPKLVPQRRHADEFSSTTSQDSMIGKEHKQSAATALQNHSVLLLYALFMNETPTKTRLRMSRHLAGQPQPLHGNAKRKQRDPEVAPSGNVSAGPSSSSRPPGSSTTPSTSTNQASTASRLRRDAIPLDDEFAPSQFQGPLSY